MRHRATEALEERSRVDRYLDALEGEVRLFVGLFYQTRRTGDPTQRWSHES